MALGLNDLAKKKKSPSTTENKSNKEHSLRPWESYDQQDTQTRTILAREAVQKAKERPQIELPGTGEETLRFNLDENLNTGPTLSQWPPQRDFFLNAEFGQKLLQQDAKDQVAAPAGAGQFLLYILRMLL